MNHQIEILRRVRKLPPPESATRHWQYKENKGKILFWRMDGVELELLNMHGLFLSGLGFMKVRAYRGPNDLNLVLALEVGFWHTSPHKIMPEFYLALQHCKIWTIFRKIKFPCFRRQIGLIVHLPREGGVMLLYIIHDIYIYIYIYIYIFFF